MGSDLEQTVEEAIGNADPTAEEIPGSEGSPDSGDSSPNGDPEPTGEDAIAFMEMVNVGVVVGTAKIRHIELDATVMELTRFTESEKQQLRPYAPYAAPYLHRISKHSEAFMAVVFCGIGGLSIFGRMKTLAGIKMSQEARPVKPSPQEKPQPEPEPGAWVANPVESTPPLQH